LFISLCSVPPNHHTFNAEDEEDDFEKVCRVLTIGRDDCFVVVVVVVVFVIDAGDRWRINPEETLEQQNRTRIALIAAIL
jgi:hypothetical protein